MNVILGKRAGLATASAVGAAVVGLAVLASACGGSPSPNSVDRLGKSGPTTTAPPALSAGQSNLQQGYQQTLAYSACMHTHGMPNFPTPQLINTPTGHVMKMQVPNHNSPQFQSANKVCKHLLPSGGNPPSQAQMQAQMAQALKFSQCMRKHGVPNFPDPTENGDSISINATGINKNSSTVQAALKPCRPFLRGF